MVDLNTKICSGERESINRLDMLSSIYFLKFCFPSAASHWLIEWICG
jgi:hypothetical protein